MVWCICVSKHVQVDIISEKVVAYLLGLYIHNGVYVELLMLSVVAAATFVYFVSFY